MDLFDSPALDPQRPASPLADRMRPRTLDEIVGQPHLMGPGKVLRRALEEGSLHSMILWGPPGTGKTTLASLMAEVSGARFVTFSAALSGVKEIRQVTAEAKAELTRHRRRTILFVDEIHRFNKAQQDAFLPHVEKGTLVLVGATTENPSFEVNSALLSRCRVYVLRPLTDEDLVAIVERALADTERGLGRTGATAEPGALRLIARLANGDARSALNILEVAVGLGAWNNLIQTQPPLAPPAPAWPAQPILGEPSEGGRSPVPSDSLELPGLDSSGPARRLSEAAIQEAAQKKALLYDKSGEEHYNLISALHKSLRDGDPDGTLYWLGRMLEAGEDPLYIARRLVRFASEDIGNADPLALRLALDAKEAYHFLGTPEGELALAQAACYLALAPKSNAVYVGFNEVKQDIHDKPAEPVPLHIRNAPTGLMAKLGYGRGYEYAHDAPDAQVSQEHLPDALRGRIYYRPTDRGAEKGLPARLEQWREWRKKQGQP